MKFKQQTLAKMFHWINLISLTLMITSGLQIYNANPVFGGRGGWLIPFPLTLGGWLAGGRHWHFAAMWVFSINLFCYGVYILVTQRWKHRFIQGQDIKALQISQNPKRVLYSKHRIAYTIIIPFLILSIISGIGMYKPAQFHDLVSLFGGWHNLRIAHFMTVPLVFIFARIHIEYNWKIGQGNLIKSIFFFGDKNQNEGKSNSLG